MAKTSIPTPVILAYALFLGSALAIVKIVAEGELSSILTVSAIFQCLGISILSWKVISSGSAAGISIRALVLDATAFSLRLSSTTWLNGYLPVDASGDWIYQAVDLCSLLMVLGLLYHLLVQQRVMYHSDKDTFPAAPMVLGALVLAALLHADMNDRPMFDMTWMASLFVGVVAVLPQLWMITQAGGEVEALTSHYIALMAISRVLSGIFMWEAREDITCIPLIKDFNHAPWVIMGAHAVHLVLLGDFAYFYMKALTKHGLQLPLSMPTVQYV